MTIILVTGGRNYADTKRVHDVLGKEFELDRSICIVQGGATGADSLARGWCLANGVPCFTANAAWTYYGKRAGNIRNGWMLEFMRPNFVIAFPGGPGTADMVKQAKVNGVRVREA